MTIYLFHVVPLYGLHSKLYFETSYTSQVQVYLSLSAQVQVHVLGHACDDGPEVGGGVQHESGSIFHSQVIIRYPVQLVPSKG